VARSTAAGEQPRSLIAAALILALFVLGPSLYELVERAGEPVVTIRTNLGSFKLRLEAQRAPLTSANFRRLVERGFYDGLTFHRVLPGFVIQGGDPDGDGSGGPGYSFADEFHRELRHDRPGRVSMANRGADTNGSQFFVVLASQPSLDDRHSVFGQVIEGFEVCRRIAALPRDGRDRPLSEARIIQARVD